MLLSSEGERLIKSFEAYSDIPYQDQRGVWTQGWGHTEGVDENSPTVDLAQAEAWFWDDIEWVEKVIIETVKIILTQCEYDALGSFIFNIGSSNFQKSSVLKKINVGDRQGAARDLELYVKYKDEKTGSLLVSKGLQARRAKEKEVFLQDFNASRQGPSEG